MNIHLPFVDATAPIQADRILRIETPLGTDTVLPERFELTEGIGGFEATGASGPTMVGGAMGGAPAGEAGLFLGRIAVRSLRHDIAAGELVGRMVDVSVELGAEPPVRRTWHCLVSELLVGPPVTRGMRSYRLTLRPAHWLLTRRRDCRIWQNVSSLDVARTVLSEHGLAAPVTDGVVAPPPPQAYSVQWGESDWAYLCRRLEQDGCAWWVRHEGGAIGSVAAECCLHIASYVSGYTESDYDDGRIRYAAGSTDRNHITRFDTAFAFVPGARAGADWNFLTPGTVPGAGNTIPSLVDLPGGALGSNHDYESFEYPSVGGYGTGAGPDGSSEGIDEAELDRLERLRAQAHEADHARVVGEGTVRTLAPGQRFTPYDVPAEAGLIEGVAELSGSAADGATQFDEHVVLSITHRAVDQSYESQGGDPEYGCSFTALPATTPATPHRRTPRPRIDGQQIALIAGPEGEEIHTDRFGRIKLWFPWDRRATKDGTDTCWVRVAQSWAGSGWGAQTIPRIGMEALVTYLDGDPDRPVVTGLVPNPRQKVPYELPENKTKTVLRSDTHKGGGHNEISFEDAAGREEVFVHAQKDMAVHVLNDRVKRVDSHEVESIGGNKNVDIAANRQEKIGGSLNVSVGGSGMGLLGILGGVVAAGGRDSVNGSSATGDDGVGQFAAAVASVGAAAEGAAMMANGAFAGAGGHRTEAGAQQTKTGSAIGGLLGKLMPMSGIVNSVIEKFRSDTIGLARTEQIGVYKNTSVGHTMTINVGEEFIIKCGESKMMMDKAGNVTIVGTKFNFAASGHVQINGKVIDLN